MLALSCSYQMLPRKAGELHEDIPATAVLERTAREVCYALLYLARGALCKSAVVQAVVHKLLATLLAARRQTVRQETLLA